MKYTANYNLKKPEGTDTVNIDDFNNNADVLDTEINSINEQIDTLTIQDDSFREQINSLGAYAVASGTNTYIATIEGYTLAEGKSVKIKFTNANTGVSTLNINSLGAKAIQKGNGSALSNGNIKAGQIVNLVCTGSVFQLLGEGGEYGTATASDVLSGKTIGTDAGIIEGTIPNRGAVNQNLTTEGQECAIPSGYHNGLGKIKAVISNLVASVIKTGETVGGVAGNFTSDATATAAQMLSGAIAYVKGNLVTGTIPSKTAQTYTPSTVNQTIAGGQYLSGIQTITGSANLIPENIKDGVNIFGKVGNLKGVALEYNSNAAENEVLINLLKTLNEEKEIYSGNTIVKFKSNFSGTFAASTNCKKGRNQASSNIKMAIYINNILASESATPAWSNDSSRYTGCQTGPVNINPGDVCEIKLISDPTIWMKWYNFQIVSRIINSALSELIY